MKKSAIAILILACSLLGSSAFAADYNLQFYNQSRVGKFSGKVASVPGFKSSTSSGYKLRSCVVNSSGTGATTVTFDSLTSMGEPVIGTSASSSYILNAGFIYAAGEVIDSTPPEVEIYYPLDEHYINKDGECVKIEIEPPPNGETGATAITSYVLCSGGEPISSSINIARSVIGEMFGGISTSPSNELFTGFIPHASADSPPVEEIPTIVINVKGTVEDRGDVTLTLDVINSIDNEGENIYSGVISQDEFIVEDVELIEGENFIKVKAQDGASNKTEVTIRVVVDTISPSRPTVEEVTSPTYQDNQILSGTKDSFTSVWMNNEERVPLDSETDWTYDYSLSRGLNLIEIFSKDPAQNESTSVEVEIDRANRAPVIISISPANKSTFYTGDTITISIDAKDEDGDELEYEYRVDDNVIQDWTSFSSFDWKTESSDKGIRNIKGSVRDVYEGSDSEPVSESVEIYIYHRPEGPPQR